MGTQPTTEPPADLEEARAQSDALRTDEPPAKAPRARKARKRAPRAKVDAAPRAVRAPALKGRIENFIVSAGAMLLLVSPNDAQLVIAGAPAQAAALDQLAKENAAVKRALEKLLTVSVYGQLVAAFAPTLIGIAANHGMVPPLVGAIAGAALSAPPADDAGTGAPPVDLAASLLNLVGGGDLAGPLVGHVVGMG